MRALNIVRKEVQDVEHGGQASSHEPQTFVAATLGFSPIEAGALEHVLRLRGVDVGGVVHAHPDPLLRLLCHLCRA